jgi:hypothetical protein
MHDRPVHTVGDPDNSRAVKAQQPGRIVNHAHSFSVVTSLRRQQA